MANQVFMRGEIIFVEFKGLEGEPNGKRYAIIVSRNDNNKSKTVSVLPVTSKYRRYHFKCNDMIEQGVTSYIMIKSITTISKDRILDRTGLDLWGDIMREVDILIARTYTNLGAKKVRIKAGLQEK